MKISESAEMYLETILVLSKKGDVHAIDIVRAMNFSRPTVSVAIHNLEKEKLLKISDEDHITLEPAGLEIAEKIYERHTVLTSFFIKLGVSENIAAEDACKIEHDISDETFECIKNHIS
ncbi:MAG: metal-dependent transcriptional regulator [Treponema sp.]|nr:metal-dependent transcriptional regulator [Treponema sp.]